MTFFEKLSWGFWCAFGVLGTIAILIFLIEQNAKSYKETQSTKQAVYDNVIQQIESTNGYPTIILGGEYSATRCDKPYEHCIRICKLQKANAGRK